MRVIVSDTSCVIDLHKAALLEEFIALPYTVAMPLPLFEHEALFLDTDTKDHLLALGLEIVNVAASGVARAMRYANQYPALQSNDCFALVVAESSENAVLLTGDKRLKTVAGDHGVTAHGVLWATDEIYDHELCDAKKLREGLRVFRDDPLVFIPNELIRKRLRRYR